MSLNSLTEIYSKRPAKKWTIPYVNKECTIKKYRSAEEKKFLLSKTDANPVDIEKAVIEIIKDCTDIENPLEYPRFILGLLAKEIRIFSYNDVLEYKTTCDFCDAEFTTHFDLKEYKFDKFDDKNLIVKMDKNYYIHLKLLPFIEELKLVELDMKNIPKNYARLSNKERDKYMGSLLNNQIERVWESLAYMIQKVEVGDKVFENLSLTEKKDYLSVMPKDHLAIISKQVEKINNSLPPAILKSEHICVECDEELKITLGSNLTAMFDF